MTEAEAPADSRRAVLFANGEVSDPARFAPLIDAEDYKVGVDGGTRHCLRMNLLPDVVIGDLDSLEARDAHRLRRAEVPFLQHSPDKDKTDLELALEHVQALDFGEIRVVGFWGGRLDQSVANLMLAARVPASSMVEFVTEKETVRLLQGNQAWQIRERQGAALSVLPLTPQVDGLSLRGTRYPLEGTLLPFGTSLGISNEILEAAATVSIARGRLLVVVERTD